MRHIARTNIDGESRHGANDLRRILGHISVMDKLDSARCQVVAERPPSYEEAGTKSCVELAPHASEDVCRLVPPAWNPSDESSDSKGNDVRDDEKYAERKIPFIFMSDPPSSVEADRQRRFNTNFTMQRWDRFPSGAANARIANETSSVSIVELDDDQADA